MATAVQVESILGGLTDNSGQPLAAGKVYTYYAGTTTPVSLYTSSDKSTSATNPLILDGHGKAQVWADGRYKFVVKDQYDVTQYTLDNLLYGFDDSTVLWGGQSTGSANVHNVSVPATVGVYANGQRVSFIAGYTNTGATTLQLNTLGAVSIVKGPNATSLQAGDIVAGQLVDCVYEAYSGTGRFRLESSPAVADIQRSRYVYATNVGGTNVIVAELTPALSSYEAGLAIRFKASAANTGAVTINLNSLGSKAVQRYGVALVGGEIKADDIVELVYDGAQFQLLNATPAPLFIDRTNNRVGIGTTSPANALEVATTGFYPQYWTAYTGASAGGANLMIRKSRGATVGTNTIVSNGDIIGSIDFGGANGTTFTSAANIAVAVDGVPGASSVPGKLVLSTTTAGAGAPAERVIISSSGNVGVGEAPGNSRLHVMGQTSTGQVVTLLSLAQTAATDNTISRLAFNNYSGVSSAIDSIQNAGTNLQSQLVFSTQTGSGLTEKMRITAGGNVGIGTSTPSASSRLSITAAASSGTDFAILTANSSGVGLLSVYSDGNIYTGGAPGSPYNNTTGIGANVFVAPNGILQRSSSSLKYKENIEDMSYGLAQALELRPVTFFMKGSEEGAQRFAGLIAEEVEAAGLPEFVQYASDGTPDSLSYGNMVALAFKAIQELNAKVESLQAQIAGA